MAKLKRKSAIVEQAMKRLAGLGAISSDLNLGNGLDVTSYSEEMKKAISRLDAYNTLLSTADAAQNDLVAQETILRRLSERMLEAVGAIYGHDSNEYEKAGGKRKVDRKRPVRKPKELPK